MITPSFGLTATERVLPKLALDFTTASLDPRITFTRALNTATVVNSSGYISPINADLPRFDYNPVTLVCKGLLIEEARTNSFTYSADFSNAIWVKQALNTTGTPPYVDVETAPDNTLSADKIITDATTNAHGIYQNVTTVVGTTYTCSYFAKASEYTYFRISDNAFSTFAATFNLTTKQVVRTSGAAYVRSAITEYKNGWFRCEITWTASQTLARPAAIGLQFDTVVTSGPSFVAGNNSDGIFVWGGQAEVGAFATSYIPTTTTALTRNADLATMTGTNFTSWYNATEGSLYTKGNTVDNVNFPGFATIGRADFTVNYMSILSLGSSSNIYAEGYTSGAIQFAITRAGNAKPNVNNGVLSYKANNFIFAANGNATANDVSGSIPTVDQLKIGRLNGNNNYLNGTIQKIMYWPQAFTASEVQAFSK